MKTLPRNQFELTGSHLYKQKLIANISYLYFDIDILTILMDMCIGILQVLISIVDRSHHCNMDMKNMGLFRKYNRSFTYNLLNVSGLPTKDHKYQHKWPLSVIFKAKKFSNFPNCSHFLNHGFAVWTGLLKCCHWPIVENNFRNAMFSFNISTSDRKCNRKNTLKFIVPVMDVLLTGKKLWSLNLWRLLPPSQVYPCITGKFVLMSQCTEFWRSLCIPWQFGWRYPAGHVQV